MNEQQLPQEIDKFVQTEKTFIAAVQFYLDKNTLILSEVRRLSGEKSQIYADIKKILENMHAACQHPRHNALDEIVDIIEESEDIGKFFGREHLNSVDAMTRDILKGFLHMLYLITLKQELKTNKKKSHKACSVQLKEQSSMIAAIKEKEEKNRAITAEILEKANEKAEKALGIFRKTMIELNDVSSFLVADLLRVIEHSKKRRFSTMVKKVVTLGFFKEKTREGIISVSRKEIQQLKELKKYIIAVYAANTNNNERKREKIQEAIGEFAELTQDHNPVLAAKLWDIINPDNLEKYAKIANTSDKASKSQREKSIRFIEDILLKDMQKDINKKLDRYTLRFKEEKQKAVTEIYSHIRKFVSSEKYLAKKIQDLYNGIENVRGKYVDNIFSKYPRLKFPKNGKWLNCLNAMAYYLKLPDNNYLKNKAGKLILRESTASLS